MRLTDVFKAQGAGKYSIFTYALADGTTGGAGVDATWNTRPLNTTEYSGLSDVTQSGTGLSFTSTDPKKYILDVEVVAYDSEGSRLNTHPWTASGGLEGQCSFIDSQGTCIYRMRVYYAKAGGASAWSFEQFIENGKAPNDFGVPASAGDNEVYVRVTVTEVG